MDYIQEGELVSQNTLNRDITPTLTPIPRKQGQAITMDFPNAVREVSKGKRIRRMSWEIQSDHGLLKDGWLTIHTKGAYHNWLVNDGDMEGQDWIVIVQETN